MSQVVLLLLLTLGWGGVGGGISRVFEKVLNKSVALSSVLKYWLVKMTCSLESGVVLLETTTPTIED